MSERGTVFLAPMRGGWGVHIQREKGEPMDRWFPTMRGARRFAATIRERQGWPIVTVAPQVGVA